MKFTGIATDSGTSPEQQLQMYHKQPHIHDQQTQRSHLPPCRQIFLVCVKVLTLQVVVPSHQRPLHAKARQIPLRKLQGLPANAQTDGTQVYIQLVAVWACGLVDVKGITRSEQHGSEQHARISIYLDPGLLVYPPKSPSCTMRLPSPLPLSCRPNCCRALSCSCILPGSRCRSPMMPIV